MSDVFKVVKPSDKQVPIVVSVPHSGTFFPEELKPLYNEHFLQKPEDTDWYVDQLYRFVTELGITLVTANYSRYVIDLNRAFDNTSLYTDSRQQTSLCPAVSFHGQPLYKDALSVGPEEVERRLQLYYWPYYEGLKSEIQSLRSQFPQVLLFDAHSIPRNVPSIQSEDFPDLILGDNSQQTCSHELIDIAKTCLRGSSYHVSYNEPFKGGHITRYFGKPSAGEHAMQLEMSQDVYMNTTNGQWDHHIATPVQQALKNMFISIIEILHA